MPFDKLLFSRQTIPLTCLISGWCYLCQDNSKFELRIRFAPGFHPPRTVYFFFPIFNWITNHESAVPASKGSNDWPKLVPENRHRLRLASTSHAEKLSPGKRGKLKITPFRHRFTEFFLLFFFHFCRSFCFKSAQRASESSCRAGGGEKIQTKTIFQFPRLFFAAPTWLSRRNGIRAAPLEHCWILRFYFLHSEKTIVNWKILSAFPGKCFSSWHYNAHTSQVRRHCCAQNCRFPRWTRYFLAERYVWHNATLRTQNPWTTATHLLLLR